MPQLFSQDKKLLVIEKKWWIHMKVWTVTHWSDF